ncbi:MAG: site-2 protease family protein [Pirellulales bacterium]|nr:site-2 protease family protein [Pirellulales bacterium]
MSQHDFRETSPADSDIVSIPEATVVEVIPGPPILLSAAPVAERHRSRRVALPLVLFAATCCTTLMVGGWAYALSLMTILVFHEMGHFLQARRYRVQASLPYFIPAPLPPIGTFGAVIAMESRRGDRRALFDIGITGPLAGLVPTLLFCIIGLQYSTVETSGSHWISLGEPLLFKWIAHAMHGPLPPGKDIILHPIAFAGWVGLLITSINLLPIGQLDGGHVLYGLLRQKAHRVASLLLLAIVGAVAWFGLWHWVVMLALLMLMGPIHPPTANDNVRLGVMRTVLGWLTLGFFVLGFTPTPILGGLP